MAPPDGTPGSERRLALLVANPATHGDISAFIAAMRAAAPPDVDVEIRYTQRGDDPLAATTGIAERADLLVAAGGDGTVATVAGLAMARGLPLGILPAGSANVVARDLGIPFDPGRAARLIFGPHDRRAIDVGRCNGNRFLHMGGAGIDSRLFLATNQARKRRLGWKAYVLPAIKHAFTEPVRFTITTESGRFSGVSPLVLVALGGCIIWPQLRIGRDVWRDDGLLDVFIFTTDDSARVVEAATRLVTGRLDRFPYLVRIRCRELELSADPAIPIEVDGDIVGDTPMIFSVAHHALDVIVPRRPG